MKERLLVQSRLPSMKVLSTQRLQRLQSAVLLQAEDDLLHREPPFFPVPFCVILALTERKSPDSGRGAYDLR